MSDVSGFVGRLICWGVLGLTAFTFGCEGGGDRWGRMDAVESIDHPSAPRAGFEEPLAFDRIMKDESQWRKELTREQYAVLREEKTERAYTSPLLNHEQRGVYACGGCGLPLFHSDQKYDSNTGWPSFWAPLHAAHIGSRPDHKLFHPRVEVHCARCDGHLGHVFRDGPEPTGLRYCLNGAALAFEPGN